MKTPGLTYSHWRSNVMLSPYILLASTIIAVALCIWVPWYPAFLGIGAALGVGFFGVTLLQVRLRHNFAVLWLVLVIPAFLWARDQFLPGEVLRSGSDWLVLLQLFCVYLAIWSCLTFLFRGHLLRRLEGTRAAQQPKD